MNETRTLTLACVLILVTIGALMVFSTTVLAFRDILSMSVWKHYVWLGLALGAMFAMTRIPFEAVWRARWHLMGTAAALLVLVFIPPFGAKVNGAYRWLRLGPASFQPSELAKVVFVIACAAFLARERRTWREDGRRFLGVIAATGVTAGLVMLEPDFGTACLFGVIGFTLMFTAGVRWRFLIPTGVGGVGLGTALIFSSRYRLDRLLGFLTWQDDLRGSGYHIYQSLLALGSGGLAGAGLGGSNQKLAFLPEAHNDFIFAILGEELGLAGTGLVLGLFLLLFLCGIRIARNLRDERKSIVAFGIILTITFQALMNIAVVTGSVPTKGIALPFVSKGGSALLISLASIGLLLRLASEAAEEEARVGLSGERVPLGRLGDVRQV
ncbi:MAG: putative lipid II flippase FtsW [Planctomycetota bacterium]